MHDHLDVLIDGVRARGGPQHCIDLHQAWHEVSAQAHTNAHFPCKGSNAPAMLLSVNVQRELQSLKYLCISGLHNVARLNSICTEQGNHAMLAACWSQPSHSCADLLEKTLNQHAFTPSRPKQGHSANLHEGVVRPGLVWIPGRQDHAGLRAGRRAQRARGVPHCQALYHQLAVACTASHIVSREARHALPVGAMTP